MPAPTLDLGDECRTEHECREGACIHWSGAESALGHCASRCRDHECEEGLLCLDGSCVRPEWVGREPLPPPPAIPESSAAGLALDAGSPPRLGAHVFEVPEAARGELHAVLAAGDRWALALSAARTGFMEVSLVALDEDGVGPRLSGSLNLRGRPSVVVGGAAPYAVVQPEHGEEEWQARAFAPGSPPMALGSFHVPVFALSSASEGLSGAIVSGPDFSTRRPRLVVARLAPGGEPVRTDREGVEPHTGSLCALSWPDGAAGAAWTEGSQETVTLRAWVLESAGGVRMDASADLGTRPTFARALALEDGTVLTAVFEAGATRVLGFDPRGAPLAPRVIDVSPSLPSTRTAFVACGARSFLAALDGARTLHLFGVGREGPATALATTATLGSGSVDHDAVHLTCSGEVGVVVIHSSAGAVESIVVEGFDVVAH